MHFPSHFIPPTPTVQYHCMTTAPSIPDCAGGQQSNSLNDSADVGASLGKTVLVIPSVNRVSETFLLRCFSVFRGLIFCHQRVSITDRSPLKGADALFAPAMHLCLQDDELWKNPALVFQVTPQALLQVRIGVLCTIRFLLFFRSNFSVQSSDADGGDMPRPAQAATSQLCTESANAHLRQALFEAFHQSNLVCGVLHLLRAADAEGVIIGDVLTAKTEMQR